MYKDILRYLIPFACLFEKKEKEKEKRIRPMIIIFQHLENPYEFIYAAQVDFIFLFSKGCLTCFFEYKILYLGESYVFRDVQNNMLSGTVPLGLLNKVVLK